MTNSPIETRHKDMAAKALDAAYFAEYGRACGAGSYKHDNWLVRFFAQTLASLEKARADLAEIDRLCVKANWSADGRSVTEPNQIAAIAAPYRASDPVAEALKAEAMTIVLAESVPRTIQQIEAIRNGIAGQGKIDLVMRALKRGMELARTIEGDR